MPGIPLVVEGLTDATFFSQLLQRVYLQDAQIIRDERRDRRNMPVGVRGTRPDGVQLEVEFRYEINGGKNQIPDIIRGILQGQFSEFAVAQDIDDRRPDQVVQSIRDLVYEHLGLPRPGSQPDNRKIEAEGRTIYVIPMGLYQDPVLASLGISSHELEDYLIKLLLEDANLTRRVLGFQQLMVQLIELAQRHSVSFHSSKELFQLAKPFLSLPISDTGAVQRIFSDADPHVLRSVLGPVLIDVEYALGVGGQ